MVNVVRRRGRRVSVHRINVWFFVVACAIGFLFSALQTNVAAFPQFFGISDVYFAAVVNCVIVVAYALAVYSTCASLGADMHDRIKWADSLYFLGFIITLIALVSALGNVGPDLLGTAQGQNSDGESPAQQSGHGVVNLIRQNAIALSSTVIALFLRTLWVLAIDDNDPTDPSLEAEVQRQLRLSVQLTRGLRDEVEALQTSVAISRRETEELATATRTSFSIYATELATHTKDEIARIMGGISGSLEGLNSATETFAERLNSVELDESALSKAIAQAMSAALGEVSSSIRRVGSTASEFAQEVDNGKTKMSQALAALDFNAILSEKIAESVAPLFGLGSTINKAYGDMFEHMRKSTSRIDSEVEAFEAALRRNIAALSGDYDEAATAGATLVDAGKHLSTAIEDAANDLAGELDHNALRLARENFVQEIETLTSKLRRMAPKRRSFWDWLMGRGDAQ